VPAPSLPGEQDRLATLRDLGILGTPPEPAFDDLTELARTLLDVPMAMVSLVDADRQWFKSAVGTELDGSPREHAFCSHAIAGTGPMVVPDALLDARFADSPLVTGAMGARFYAGVPLRVRGWPVGTLCVVDHRPRTLDAAGLATLERLAGMAARALEGYAEARTARLAQERLADFLASSGDWLWETDGLRVRWVSDNIERVLGVPVASYQDHLIVERLVDDDAETRAANARALAAIRDRAPFRDLRVRRDTPGGTRVVVKSGVPVRDASGTFVGYRGVSRDVTEASEAGLAASLAERRLNEAIEVLDEAFVLTDAQGRIVHTNAHWRAVNLAPGAPVPADWMSHLQSQIATGAIESAVGREVAFVAERLAHREACGAPMEVRVRGRDLVVRDRRLSDGSIASVGQDISELRAEHRATVDAVRRLRLATSAARLKVYEIDLEAGTIASVVDAPPGDDSPEVPERVDAALTMIEPDDRPAFEAGLRAVWDGELDVFRDEVGMRGPEGRLFRMSIAVALEPTVADRSRRLVAVRQDVTALRHAEEAARLKTAAELANRSKSEFLSRVGHELRTPLNAIRGLAQVMQREAADGEPPARRAMLGHVLTASEHLAALLDDLLDMSQVETGRLAIRSEPVEVAAVMRDCLRMIAPQAAGHGIGLECGRVRDGLRVLGDATRLRQILLNLASNAVKYNRPQGRVRIDAEADRGDGLIRITVTDTGPGFTREEAARIFRPFERLARGDGVGAEGLGLGLSIAQGLAQAMGGSIAVDSEPGRGTTFTVHLPAAPEAVAGPEQRDPADRRAADGTPAAEQAPAPRRVLYVEDNRLNGLLMSQIARQVPGLVLKVVETGEEALASIGAFAPDLLLLDNDLPGIHGLELHRLLKDDPRWASLRVVLVSADATAESIVRARDQGFDDYWVKPLDVSRVIAELGGAPGPERVDAATGA
jgi:signal transduction histidine kinase/ActR/RegA family two-component response regulator